MKDKILPIIITIISSIALILTIIMNIIYPYYEYKTPGNGLWIVLECGIILIAVVQIFFMINYVYGILLFGASSGIIIGIVYMIFEFLGIDLEPNHLVLFFLPHIIIYSLLLIMEIIYIRKHLKANL